MNEPSSAPQPAGSPTPDPLGADPTVISRQPPEAAEFAAQPLRLKDIGQALQGQQLGHFYLESFVGGGGMGAVFQAIDTQLERTVAVKVLTQPYGPEDETVRRFRVEAQSAARLNHEHIARVHFVGEDKGWNFIVFEFIEGENLRDLVARTGPLAIEQVVQCAIQLADALQHATERNVVHRDIKPSNVLLTPEGRAKLVDMGLARLRQVESAAEELTVSGVTLGTFDYISPEQGRDPRSADARSDLYSLGCTIYFMLTGQPPYPSGTALQKLLSHTSDPPPDPRRLRPEVPVALADIVLRLLAKLPEERYQQPVELLAELSRLDEAHDLPRHLTGYARFPAPHRHWPWPANHWLAWLGPFLLLVAAAIALDMLLAPAPAPGPEPEAPMLQAPAARDAEPLPRGSADTLPSTATAR